MWESLSRIGQQVIQELKEEEEEGEGWGDWKLDGTTEVPHTQNSTSMELEEAKLQLDVHAQQTHELMQQLEQYKQLYQQLKDTLQQQDHTEADTSAVKVPILAWEQSQQHNKIISDIKALLDIQDDQGIFDTIKSNMNKATEYKKQVEQVNENFKLVHDELEDLRKAENNARNSGKKQEEQYNSLVEQMKKLQSDCRDAYKKEEESRKELERVALDLAKYRDSSLELEVELREARSTEDNLNRQLAIVSLFHFFFFLLIMKDSR
jgi:chromosome segregation ATPase